MVGMIGRVTGTVKPGSVGEVRLIIAGEPASLHAYPSDGESTYAIGARVMVVEFLPPQTVYVDLYAL